MGIAAGVVFGCLFIALAHGTNPVEAAIFSELERIPDATTRGWQVIVWSGSWPGILLAAGLALYAGRLRLGAILAAAGVSAGALALLLQWLTPPRAVPETLGHLLRAPASGGFDFPSVHVAVITALTAVAVPYLGRVARHASWTLVVLVAVGDVFLATHLPVGVVCGAALGWGTAAAYHLVLGAPGRATSDRSLQLALEAVGLGGAELVPVKRRFLRPETYLLTTSGGEQLTLKVVRRLHRLAGPSYKLRRLLASVEVEDEPALSTPRHEVEHEAYVTLLAERAGVGTLPVYCAGEIRHGPPFLVRRRLPGRLLCDCTAAQVPDELLDRLLQDVLALGRIHVTHHALLASTILVDEEGRPRITDFTFGRVGGPESRHLQDLADVLVTITSVVGVARAADSALRGVPRETLLAVLPRLQWLALHHRLRSQLTSGRVVLADLRETLAEALDSAPPQFRSPVRPVTLVVLLAVGLAVYLLLPQLSSLGQVLTALDNADRGWIAVAVVAGLLAIVASGISILGSCRQDLPVVRTLVVQLAAAFTGRTTVGGLGFYGVNIVYLERCGLLRAHAVGALLLNRGITGLVTAVATVLGVLVIGSAVPVDLRPPPWPLLLGAGVVLLVAAGVLASQWGRRRVWRPLRALVREVLTELVPTLRAPVRAVQLFGGTVLYVLLQAFGLAATLAAFQPDVRWLPVMAVYVVGSTLGQLAPTPGGLGTVEAATVAAMSAIGVGPTTAVATVLTSRALTFWLPVVPGAVAFRVLQHRGVV